MLAQQYSCCVTIDPASRHLKWILIGVWLVPIGLFQNVLSVSLKHLICFRMEDQFAAVHENPDM